MVDAVACIILDNMNGCAELKLAGLMEEYGEFDVALVRELLQDQGEDVLEVRVYLGVSAHLASVRC